MNALIVENPTTLKEEIELRPEPNNEMEIFELGQIYEIIGEGASCSFAYQEGDSLTLEYIRFPIKTLVNKILGKTYEK